MDNLEPEGTRGGLRPPIGSYGGDFAPPVLRVKLRGRGRARRMRRAVSEGLRRGGAAEAESYEFEWPTVVGVEPVGVARVGEDEEELRYPRRRDAKGMDPYGGPPMMPREEVKVSAVRTLRRLLVYLYAAARWYTGTFWEILHRRNTIESRALRLREIIEGLGGTAIKIGQQASLRMDLLPREYGAELEKMLDRVPPFPTELAVAQIEALTGKPLDETFAEFNREPYGSASVACVYDAVLLTGERVAVKVRRPGIKELFASDCKALEWALRTLEFLTLLRDDFSKNLVTGLRTILLEEADFIKEARYTEIFRRRARKNLKRVSAPKIYFDFSGEDVIVQEFITGVKMGDMIAFVEQNDEEALERLRQLNINPEKIAKKLIRVNQYGVFENTLFHADPHPSNLIVRPNNHLVFIDFGAVGAYTTMERNNWRQLNYYHQRRDVGRMAQTALAILEPLPAIDIDAFRGELEQVFWQDIYAHQSKHTAWYEHTSVRIWMHLFELSYKYNIPMGLNTLRMIRSTLLSETVAARLYPKISAWREHQKYNRQAARRSRRRVLRSVARRICGPTDTDYQRIEQCEGIINRTIYLYQRWLDTPLYRYGMLVKKIFYFLALFVKLVINFISIGTLSLIAYIVYDFFFNNDKDLYTYAGGDVVTKNFWRMFNPGASDTAWPIRVLGLIILVHFFLILRRSKRRFWDKDLRRRNTSGLS